MIWVQDAGSSNLPTRTKKEEQLFAVLLFCFEGRFEQSNTSVRWTLVRFRLDGIDTLLYRISPLGPSPSGITATLQHVEFFISSAWKNAFVCAIILADKLEFVEVVYQ